MVIQRKGTSLSMWGVSSAGRAPALHAGGQEFESPKLHHLYYLPINKFSIGGVAQLVRAIGSYPIGRGFESPRRHQIYYS